MNLFLTLAFLFFIGSVSGWILEVLFRRFFSSANPDRKWLNPGFCTGPYLPLYGFGLCLLYLIAQAETLWCSAPSWKSRLIVFLAMATSMTAIEYLAGILSLKIAKVRLWDYTGEWGNLQGIICPKFSLFWAILGALYYFLIHPSILGILEWLSCNLAFSFVIGLFFGVFLVDVVNSAQLIAKLKQYAEENRVIIRYEAIKTEIRRKHELSKKKYHFFLPFRTAFSLAEHLKDLKGSFEKLKQRNE